MDAVFEAQNAGKPGKAQLKSGHMEMMKVLVRLLKKELGSYQVFGRKASADGFHLRSLRTNSVQIAGMLKCSIRTVRNRLNRLEASGWLKKVWHGSNAAFEVMINLDLLHLQETAACHSNSVSALFANPCPCMRQFLPHTLSGVPRQDTNKSNELSGLPLGAAPAATATPSPAESAPPVTPVQQGTEQDTQAGYQSGNQDKQQDTSAGYHPSSADPAEKRAKQAPLSKKVPQKKVSPAPRLPRRMADVTEHLSEKDRARLPRLIDIVWDHAFAELDEWMPGYLVSSEIKKGKIGLAEFFAYGNPERWKDAADEFISRIDMVTAWCERRTQAGKKAFIPLPSVWFDHRNPQGFARTKGWYQTRQHDLAKVQVKGLVNTALKQYTRALESNGGDVDETIRVIRQRLEKRGGTALFQLFLNRIQTVESLNKLSA